ncbi:hypothetical protein SAMN05421847_3019 [Halpernia humi]|uniref:Uncharacterized protein n=1 Tax=Halpernia humi TaxID=493375 RepID=A0A1H6BRF4_9FLAO|nr:hypothetical protein [Halpernia humi]SEG62796.1 hypothetical protein SAMN05421847_3019 [Halpernia humi]
MNKKSTFSIIFLTVILVSVVYFVFFQTAEKQIKKTVSEYWTLMEKGEFNQSVKLFHDGESYSGGLHMYFYKLQKHYKYLNEEKKFKENIIVKDTTYIGQKMKYVQYYIKDKKQKKPPLIITFIFWKENGYDNIYSTKFENLLEWY